MASLAGHMSVMGHSRLGRTSCKSGHVRYAAESRSRFRALAAPQRAMRLEGIAADVIQAPKLEPRIMRYELSDYEWTAIKPMLPNKPRGIRRVNDRRVLNGIFWVLRSGAPWRVLPETYGCLSAYGCACLCPADSEGQNAMQ
jgi:hypothetical protein